MEKFSNYNKKMKTNKNTNNKKDPELLKQIQQLCLMDDTFMTIFFDGQNDLMEFVLKIILNTQDLKVLQTKTQIDIHSIAGRSARLDVVATDSKGKHYNFEVQNADDGAVPKRARFNSSMLDSTLLKKNAKYSDLPETYVIFFTKNDVLKGNLPIYNIERIISQNQQIFGDGTHIIYVNGAYKSQNALGKLVQDFHCRDPKKMNYNELAERSNYLKYLKGATKMGDSFEKFVQKRIKEAIKENNAETKRNFAINLLKITELSESVIAASADLSLSEVKKLSKKIRKTKIAN